MVPIKLPAYNLLNIKQRDQMNNTLSNPAIILFVVLQWFILSPILLNLQINQINKLKIRGKLVCYLDDTTIQSLLSKLTLGIPNVIKHVKNYLRTIIQMWLTVNNLFQKLEKTHVLPHYIIIFDSPG